MSRGTFERTQVDLVPGWLIVAAKQGKKAAFDKLLQTGEAPRALCADEFDLRHVQTEGDSTVCFAIADGVGNEPDADLGARLAVGEAVDAMAEQRRIGAGDRIEFEKVLDAVHRRLVGFAEGRRIAPSTIATTLLIGSLDTASAKLACACVGDAFVVAQSENRTWSFPPLDEFEVNAGTYSITDRNWGVIARYGECPFAAGTIIAFTDGLRHVMFKIDRADPRQVATPHEDAILVFRKAIMDSDNASRGRAVSALLGFSDDRKMMEDDRTIIIMQKVAEGKGASRPAIHKEAPSPISASPRGDAAPPRDSTERRDLEKNLRQPTQAQRDPDSSQLLRSQYISYATLNRKLSLSIGLGIVTSLLLLLSFAIEMATLHTAVTRTSPANLAGPASTPPLRPAAGTAAPAPSTPPSQPAASTAAPAPSTSPPQPAAAAAAPAPPTPPPHPASTAPGPASSIPPSPPAPAASAPAAASPAPVSR